MLQLSAKQLQPPECSELLSIAHTIESPRESVWDWGAAITGAGELAEGSVHGLCHVKHNYHPPPLEQYWVSNIPRLASENMSEWRAPGGACDTMRKAHASSIK